MDKYILESFSLLFSGFFVIFYCFASIFLAKLENDLTAGVWVVTAFFVSIGIFIFGLFFLPEHMLLPHKLEASLCLVLAAVSTSAAIMLMMLAIAVPPIMEKRSS